MQRPLPSVVRLAAGLTLSATGALAQPVPAAAERDALPACSDQGIRRVAVMVPPGQTTEQLRDLLAGGTLFPAGTEALILQPRQLARLRNEEEFQERLRLTLDRFLREGTKIDGTLSVLLVLDAAGDVREAHPNTKDRQVNRTLAATWKQARFEPYVHEGCRIPAWVHVPLTFASDWEASRRQVQVRTGPPR